MQVHSVDEITTYIKQLLEGDLRLQQVWIRGELSGLRHPTRHLYFSLKDDASVLPCVMFHRWRQHLNFTPENGDEVVVRGTIGVYKPQGRYQCYVHELVALGQGLLYARYEKLKRDLAHKGYFAAEHKRPLPFLPQRIGIATSLDGAALRDILTVLERRFPNLEIVVAPCRVQGDNAPKEIASAISRLNRFTEVDLIIAGRGGGSMEDLFAFNDPQVAQAVFESRIPIITGIGHEIDTSIADLAADAQAPTPTAAAQRAVPRKEQLVLALAAFRQRFAQAAQRTGRRTRSRLEQLGRSLRARHPVRSAQQSRTLVQEHSIRLQRRINQQVSDRRLRLDMARQSLLHRSPRTSVNTCRREVQGCAERIARQLNQLQADRRGRLATLHHRLQDLSPLSVLARGYSICFDESGRTVLRRATQVAPGDRIQVHLAQGRLHSQVLATEEDET